MTTPLLPLSVKSYPTEPPPPPSLGSLEDEVNLVIESNIMAGNLYKALQLIHRRLILKPNDPTLRYLQAEIYFLSGYYEKAQALFSTLDISDPCVELYLLHCINKIKPSIETATKINILTTEYMDELGLPFEQEMYVDDLHRGNYDKVLAWIYEQPFYRFSYDLLLSQACIHLKKGQTESCTEILKTLIAVNPQNLIRRPFYMVTPGIRSWMVEIFKQPEILPISILLPFARVFSEFKEDELSVKLYQEIARRFPSEGFIHALTGLQEAISKDRCTGWQERFEKALTHCLDNERTEIIFYYAQSYFARQDWNNCLSQLESIKDIPEKSHYCILLGDVLIKLGLYQRGKECYEQALQIAPSNPTFWKGKGICESALGNYHEALYCFNESLKIYPYHPVTLLHRCRIRLLLKQDPSLVMEDYNQARWLNPNTPEEILASIQEFVNKGESKRALQETELFLFCVPNHSEAFWWHARIQLDLGLDKGAIKALNRFFTLVERTEPSRHLTYINLLLKLGSSFEARCHLERHSWLAKQYPLGYAVSYLESFRQGDAAEYGRELEKFLSKWPDSFLQLIELAIIKIRNKKYTQALRHLEKAHTLDATPRVQRLIDWLHNHLATPQNHLTPYSEDPVNELIRYAELFFKVWQKLKGPKNHVSYDVMSNAPYRINILVLELFSEKKEWYCPVTPKTPLKQLLDEEIIHLAYLLHTSLPGAILAARLTLFKAVKLTLHCPRHPYPYLDSLQNQACDPEAFDILDLERAHKELLLVPPDKPLQPLFEEDPAWMEPIPLSFPHLASLSD